MAHYETDAHVLEWFDRTLTHPVAHVRISALSLLSKVDCSNRRGWLRRAQSDPVAEVVATAALLEAVVSVESQSATDLFESDFAEQLDCSDLAWEWEYDVVVAHGALVQMGVRNVWTAHEDDRIAGRIALQRAYSGKESEVDEATAIIVGKRLVNQYTRLPRSTHEATHWLREGRPRYRE